LLETQCASAARLLWADCTAFDRGSSNQRGHAPDEEFKDLRPVPGRISS
jgi:hypothetical protein